VKRVPIFGTPESHHSIWITRAWWYFSNHFELSLVPPLGARGGWWVVKLVIQVLGKQNIDISLKHSHVSVCRVPYLTERYDGCSPLSRRGFFRASNCILTGFTALGQLFARDYRDLGVR